MVKKKTRWIEIARRGTSQPLIVIDALIELNRLKMFGQAHRVKWSPTHYRQFDDARWFSKESMKKYQAVLQEGEERNKGYLLTNAQEFERRITAYRRFVDRYRKIDFSEKTNKQLAKIFKQWFEHTKRFWCFGYDYIFINKYMPEEVIQAISRQEPDIIKQNKYLGVLFMADALSEMWQEKKALLNLAELIQKNRMKFTSDLAKKRINRHLSEYAHLGFYYFRGQAYSDKEIISRLKLYIRLTSAQFDKLHQDVKNQRANKQHTQRLVRQLKLDQRTVHKIRILKRWAALSNYVDETYSYAVHQLDGLWQEIAKRLGLKIVRELASLRADETLTYLLKGSPKGLLTLARIRLKDHAIILENKKVKVISGNQLARYRKTQQTKKKSFNKVKELKGQAASSGKVRGIVRVVYTMHDLKKVEPGNIMVTDATNPAYVPAMERSAAIVTDEGGLLCHAAIVSRELKIPCIVGTEISTRVFKDGDRVSVDAKRGIIKKI